MTTSRAKTSLHRFAASAMLLAPALAAAQGAEGGRVERILVHGDSLEGNLLDVSPERDVFVYLPPSYDEESDRRYPVVYNLHGWLPDAEQWIGMLSLEQGADRAIAAGAREMIVVAPDTNYVLGGSMYSSSIATGDFERFVTEDLIEHIDSSYRTIPTRASRGMSGHSMGGYGAVRIAMKYPELYSSLYAMSSCCLLPAGADANVTQAAGIETLEEAVEAPIFVRVAMTQAAAWSPNPNDPPFYFDLPIENGEEQPLVIAKWAANAPLAMLDQHVGRLERYDAIAIDVGREDGLISHSRALHEALEDYGIAHQYETYEGNHTNRVAERLERHVLPFFSKHLAFEE